MPEVPPIASSGVPGFRFYGWHGMLAPAKTPLEIMARLNAALNIVQTGERLKKVLMDNGATPAPPGPPEDLTKAIEDDLTIGRKLLAEHKITLD
jgi:tripartite-type tricarboxylate transporter receptor subunit TctC